MLGEEQTIQFRDMELMTYRTMEVHLIQCKAVSAARLAKWLKRLHPILSQQLFSGLAHQSWRGRNPCRSCQGSSIQLSAACSGSLARGR